MAAVEKDTKDLEDIRKWLRQAAEIQDPREMWYALRDILNALTLIVVPNPEV